MAADGPATRATSGSSFIAVATRLTSACPLGDATGTPGSTMATSEGTAEAPVAATISSCARTDSEFGSLKPLAERFPMSVKPMARAAAAMTSAAMMTRMGCACDTRAMRWSTPPDYGMRRCHSASQLRACEPSR